MADPINIQKLKDEIGHVESGGNYAATNPQKGSTATGKYQFVWSKWGKEISEVTGVKSRQAFLGSPKAQEEFMDHYSTNILIPRIQMLRQEGLGNGYSDADLGKFIHLEGAGGATTKLRNGTLNQATGNNLSPLQYVAQSKTGSSSNINSNIYGGGGSPYAPEAKKEEVETNTDTSEDTDDSEYQKPQSSIYDQVKSQVEAKYGKYDMGGSTPDLSGLPDVSPNYGSAAEYNQANTNNINIAAPNYGSAAEYSKGFANAPAATDGSIATNANASSSSSSSKEASGKALAAGITGATDLASGFLNDDANNESGIVNTGAMVSKGALKGASTGATAGSAFGPVGTIVGAGVGAIAGEVSGYLGSKKLQKSLTKDAVTRADAHIAGINNHATTTDINPYGTQMANGGYAMLPRFDEGGYNPAATGINGNSAIPGQPIVPIAGATFAGNKQQMASAYGNSANNLTGTAQQNMLLKQTQTQRPTDMRAFGVNSGSGAQSEQSFLGSNNITGVAAPIVPHAANNWQNTPANADGTVNINPRAFAQGSYVPNYYAEGSTVTSDNPAATGTLNAPAPVNQPTTLPMTQELYSKNFMNNVGKYAGTMARSTHGVLTQAPQLQSTYNALDARAQKNDPTLGGQTATDENGVNHAAMCASVGCAMGYASGDKLGVYNDPAEFKKSGKNVDLNNGGQGSPGTQTSYDAMIADKQRGIVSANKALPGDAIFFFNKDGSTDHMQRYMPDTDEKVGNSDSLQKVARAFDDDGYNHTHVSVYPEQPGMYKLKKGEVLGSMNYAARQQLMAGKTVGDYYGAKVMQRNNWTGATYNQPTQSTQPMAQPVQPKRVYEDQHANGSYVNNPGMINYEDGSTVHNIAQVPPQAQPQDVAPMQPGQHGQPEGQPQQNMIDIEKGELRIDPKSGKILQQYTGINPSSGTKYQRHNSNPDIEPAGNFVPADPGQFIITVKDSKRYKTADENNDSILKGTIMRNIINNKNKPQEGNYKKGSYVVPSAYKFDGGGDIDVANPAATGTPGRIFIKNPESAGLPKTWNTDSDAVRKVFQDKLYNQTHSNQDIPTESNTNKNIKIDRSNFKNITPQNQNTLGHYQESYIPFSHPGVTAANNKAIANAPHNNVHNANTIRNSALDNRSDSVLASHIDNIHLNPTLQNNALNVDQSKYISKINNDQLPEIRSNYGQTLNQIGNTLGQYGPSFYNLARGMRAEHEATTAPQYNPNEGQVIGNMPQYMNYEPQRQEALRQANAQQYDIDQHSNSSAVARSNKNNVYSNTQNNLANIRFQNDQANNQTSEYRGNTYNMLGQQRTAADQYAQNYNMNINNINAQNRGAANNSTNAGIAGMQQTSQNNDKNAQLAANDHYILNTLMPRMYPSSKAYDDVYDTPERN